LPELRVERLGTGPHRPRAKPPAFGIAKGNAAAGRVRRAGGHDPAFDAACDVLERRLDAERSVIPGAGHSVQRTGAPFNERLETFLTAAAAD
jgi:hypothetical protein